jgi:hypothetical protein
MNVKYYSALIVLLVSCCFAAMAETTQQFVKVTDASTLVDGDEIIFANTEYQVALSTTSSSTGHWKAVSVGISENVLTPTDDVQRFSLKKSGEKFYIKSTSGKYLLGNSNGFVEATSSASNQYWKITCCEDSAYVVDNKNSRKLNLNDDHDLFSCYVDYASHCPVSIFRKTEIAADKQQTKISFSTGETTSFVVKKGKEQEFSAPTATLTDADGNEIEAELTYASSNSEIVSVDSSAGSVTFNDGGVYGTATITASFAGNDDYEASQASYTIEYVNKSQAQLSFGENYDGKTITVYQGKETEFVSPMATLSPQGIGDIVYSSSNESVVTVNASGEVTFVALGEAVIKAVYSGNDDYLEAYASYTISYVAQSLVFSSGNNSFDNLPTSASSSKKTVTFVSADNNTYSFAIKNAFKKDNKLCISGSGTVSLSNPFGFLNGYTVVVNFMQSYSISSPSTLLSMCYNDGNMNSESIDAVLTKANSSNSEFVATLDVPGDYVFTITAGANQAKISSVEITPNPIPNLTFDEDADNQSTITANAGQVAVVTLKRTLVAGKWNTFCVPFSVTDLSATYDGIEVKTYDDEKGVDGNTMYFKNVDEIVAGQPYLVKPKTDIVNPVFQNVRLSATDAQSVGSDDYKFVGVFSPLLFDADSSGKSLFLASDGSLMYPDAGTTMRGMRAYFLFPGETKADVAKVVLDSDEAQISNVVMDGNVSTGSIFSLHGMYVGNEESKLSKGIYIKNGKKVVVK